MPGVTEWVRRAFAELGPDATTKKVTNFLLANAPTVPTSKIPLDIRKLKQRGLAVGTGRPQSGQSDASTSQRQFDFPE